MLKLGVNIDHVATLRQARRTFEPDPVEAAKICQRAGADSIVAHLREDRRHIQDEDMNLIKKNIAIKFNMEMAATSEIVKIACELKPHQATLVPEKRQEVTTEGGLDVSGNKSLLEKSILSLKKSGISVSIFIEPLSAQIKASKEIGADAIEIHTGKYANTEGKKQQEELEKIIETADLAHTLDLGVYAGHGLNYENVKPIVSVPFMEELNIGHSIISRAVFVGLENAVKEMLDLIRS
ncbi:MAG: pyridoxine 5'-phosphate synthase [Candidatus Ratteibacteria bacterium]|nr:pyridoxine 5'-phosphate synthase [Candidatus Ratteibacteria bacterium]